MTNRLQQAISLAVQNHPGLGNKAFEITESGSWVVRPEVETKVYSSTEAMIVGLLVEIYERCHGFQIQGLYEAGQRIWPGATDAADLFDRLDFNQQPIIKALLVG